MTRKFRMTILFSVVLIGPQLLSAQNRGTTPAPKATPPPAQPTAPPAQPTPPPAQATRPPAQAAPPSQAGKRGEPPKVQPPMTLRQVIESLLSTRNSARVETLVAQRGIQFQ